MMRYFLKASRRKQILAFVLIAIFLFLPVSYTYATQIRQEESIIVADSGTGGWVGDDPAGIYNGKTPGNTEMKDLSDPKFPETWIIILLRAPGDLIYELEKLIGMTIDSIVYGRVLPDGPAVNYYKFELVKGNFFGTAGSYIYNIFRLIGLVVLWCIFGGQLLKMLFITNTGKAREEVKASISKLVMISLMFFLMPYFWQLINYIFDALLYLIYTFQGSFADTIKNGFSGSGSIATEANKLMNDGVGGVSGGIVAVFGAMADKSWIGALAYTGVVCLALYYAFSYIKLALSMFIYYILFPFVCVFSYADKGVLNSWFKNVLSGLIVPFIDAILLLLPAIAFSFLASVNIVFCGIICLMLCCLVIPSRNLIKSLLNIQGAGLNAFASAGLSAMAIMQAGRMIGGKVAGIREHAKNSKNAKKEADRLDEVADVMEGRNADGSDNMDANRNANGLGALPITQSNGASGGNSSSGESNSKAYSGYGSSVNTGAGSPVAGMYGGSPEMYKLSSTQYKADASRFGASAAGEKNKANTARMTMNASKENMRDIEARYNITPNCKKDSQKPVYATDANGNVSDTVLGYSDMDIPQEDVMAYTAATDSYNSAKNDYEQANASASGFEVNRAEASASASEMDYRGAYTKMQQDAAIQRINDAYATIGDVHSPSFAKVSPRRQAELLRQYAKSERRKAIGGSVGMVAGMSAGMSASLFYDSSTKAMMIGAGAVMGGSAYEAASAIGNEIKDSTMGRAVRGGFDMARHDVSMALSDTKAMRGVNRTINTGTQIRNDFRDGMKIVTDFEGRAKERANVRESAGTWFDSK